MKRFVIFFVPAILLACGPGFLPQMDKLAADPTIEKPQVTSFLDELSCLVEWTADPAAESYVLERSSDTPTPVFETIYTGLDTSYTDTDCQNKDRYLYRLRKTKGDRLFDASDSALGVGSQVCRDLLEPNDTEETATPLEYELQANMFFFRSCAGDVVQDGDWYSVSIPPRRAAHIIITQTSELPTGATNTFLYFYLQGGTRTPVVNSGDIRVENTSFETKAFLFLVYPNSALFAGTSSQAGGNIVGYTVSLDSITGL